MSDSPCWREASRVADLTSLGRGFWGAVVSWVFLMVFYAKRSWVVAGLMTFQDGGSVRFPRDSSIAGPEDVGSWETA